MSAVALCVTRLECAERIAVGIACRPRTDRLKPGTARPGTAQTGTAQPDALNASGRAGSGAVAAAARAAGHSAIPIRSRWAVTVPGCVDGWEALADRHGALPLAASLGPAIALATDGFPASWELSRSLARLADVLLKAELDLLFIRGTVISGAAGLEYGNVENIFDLYNRLSAAYAPSDPGTGGGPGQNPDDKPDDGINIGDILDQIDPDIGEALDALVAEVATQAALLLLIQNRTPRSSTSARWRRSRSSLSDPSNRRPPPATFRMSLGTTGCRAPPCSAVPKVPTQRAR